MKRILALILVAVLAFAFAGCAEKSGEVKYAEAPETSMPEKGKITGDTYESTFADITFTKPEGWIFATDEEIAGIEAGDGIYYDMVCQNPDTGSQVAVMFEETLLTIGNVAITEDEYIKAISEGLYNSGLEVISQEDKKIGEENYKSVTVYGEAEELTVMQTSLARKKGNTMISVVAVAFNEDNIDDILKCFVQE
ncbi:MAG: hypothetical protein Q4G23_07035 [Clostridia bacterium]|nr:hypothetical protein [Clostridia bacterium]